MIFVHCSKSAHAISKNRSRVFWLPGNNESFECVIIITHEKCAVLVRSSKAHLTGYFLTCRCVYLLDSAGKGCSLEFFKFVVLFSGIMFLKSDLFYFVLVGPGSGDLVQYTKFFIHCTFSSCVYL